MALATTRLSPKAQCVQFGYGQVEPNHLSARRNGQIYAQLPAAASIDLLENGQFAKYDYENGVVNFTGAGEWLLVFNEVKVYEDYQTDADFAMKKTNYAALVYNAMGDSGYYHYNVHNEAGANDDLAEVETNGSGINTSGMMPTGTTMVPRLLRTQPGDIMTTNCIKDTYASLNVGSVLKIDSTDGYLSTSGDVADQEWTVVKKYNMPDLQPGVKLQRTK
jgi:hypothetical protein